MRFALMIEPQQGLTYADQLEIARHAEAGGFETLLRSDHYESFPGPDDNPTTDAWAVLAGLARETTRIGLGALVSPVTFRLPGNLAKVATTVDEMSGGRIEVGLGAGWNESEHRRYGFPFPPISERAEMLEEQLEIMHGLWTQPDGWSFHGRHYAIEGARFRAKPFDGYGRPNTFDGSVRPRIIVGGDGKPRSMRIGVRWADEYNITSSDPVSVAEKERALDDVCHAAGRDPSTLTRSAMVGVLVGANAGELDKRETALIKALELPSGGDWLATRRGRWIFGTPDEARDTVRRFAEAGVERIMLQDFVPWDLEMIDLLGEELVGKG
jgi:F420-dependent oxidoreductase-like protein